MSSDVGGIAAAVPSGESSTTRRVIRWIGGLSSRLEQLFEGERAQLSLWLPVGLMLGIAAWFWLPDRAGWNAFIAGSLAAALGFAAFAGETRWGRAVAICSLAAALGAGLIWWKAERVAAPRIQREQLVVFDARIEAVQPLAAERSLRLLVAPTARLPREGAARVSPERH